MFDWDILASSFFSYVFWKGEVLFEVKCIIFEYELVYVWQCYSLDVLLMECYLILKWFNLLVYVYCIVFQQVYEYIVDVYVLWEIGSCYIYVQFLALQCMGYSCYLLVNIFVVYLRSWL